MNPVETEIREYIITRSPERKIWLEEDGRYLNGARMVLVSDDSLENPSYCQVKISGMTKTYKFTDKISRINK